MFLGVIQSVTESEKRWTSLFPELKSDAGYLRLFGLGRGFFTLKKEENKPMKKYLSLFLAALMVFALCACGADAPAETAAPEVESAAPAAEAAVELNTVILKEEDESMINNYTLLAVDPEAPFADADGNPVDDVELNTVGADALINWLLSEEGEAAVAEFGMEQYGDHLFYLKEDRPVSDAEIPEATDETKVIRMSTTTSVNDSGLLGYLLPMFEEQYGYEVEVNPAGTGEAIAAAEMGNADLLLVHAKAKEEDFVSKGFARIVDGMEAERLTYMYNYFVLCGPQDDPAGVADAEDVPAAFAAIAEGKYTFISRGDGSGTHTKELSLWPEDLGITEEPESFADFTDWYISANAGMGTCLVMAEEMGGYILTDKATFLTFVANGGVMD